MDKRFDAVVLFAPLDGCQPFPDLAYPLMMGTVDHSLFPVQGIQTGVFQNPGGMILVAILVAVQLGSGKVLGNGATQRNIDYLHAFTDAQYGKGVPDSIFQSLKLQNVQFCINISGSSVLFPKKSGGDISASRQNKGAAGGNFSGNERGEGIGRKSRNIVFLVSGVSLSADNSNFYVFQ